MINFVLFLNVLLLFIGYGQCFTSLTAIADLRLDGTETSIGQLSFTQAAPGAPVRVNGTLQLQSTSSSHVC